MGKLRLVKGGVGRLSTPDWGQAGKKKLPAPKGCEEQSVNRSGKALSLCRPGVRGVRGVDKLGGSLLLGGPAIGPLTRCVVVVDLVAIFIGALIPLGHLDRGGVKVVAGAAA